MFSGKDAKSISNDSKAQPNPIKNSQIDESQLSQEDKVIRSKLIDDTQNLSIALGFSPIPEADRIRDTNNSAMIAFHVIGYFLNRVIDPKPYDKIKISVDGPKNDAMGIVLTAALDSLKQLDPAILHKAMQDHKNQYDLVKTKLAGNNSLSSTYGMFAWTVGTVTNQPGEHIATLVKKINNFFDKYKNLLTHKKTLGS
jgi:hypothetical protein